MDPFEAIRRYLRAVRRRLRRREALRALAFAGAAALLLALAGGLVASVASERALVFMRQGLVLAAGVAVVASIVVGVVLPRRRLRRDGDVARYIGAAAPALASDLLSTVELEDELRGGPRRAPPGGPRFSEALARALARDTHERLEVVDPDRVVPPHGLRRAGIVLGLSLLVFAAGAVIAPSRLSAGFGRLVHPPPPQLHSERAIAVAEPIVGDLRLVVSYPAYTGRPPLVVPAATGDLSAPRGTRVFFETTALRPAATARLVFDDPAEAPQPLVVEGREVRGSFLVDRPRQFRFELTPTGGRPLVEAEPHRVEVEPDRPPRVELVAPAEELDVADRRRVELAYDIDDDYGIAKIELVWKGDGKEERKVIAPPRAGARSAQAKFYWDLNEITLAPGTRIAYHLEARDNDDVGGPNVGVSRTYWLRVYSPRERHEEVLQKQQAVFEQLVRELAGRLVIGAEDIDGHLEALGGLERLTVDLGALISLVAADTLAPKGLKEELEGMHTRLEKLARDEQTAVTDLSERRARAAAFVMPRAVFAEADRKIVLELERDVLAFDDWLQRQRLEELLAISDEIKQHREKLKDLLAQYSRSRSAETRAAIEREIRAIEQRIAELQAKAAQLSSEVADRFVNAEAMDAEDAADCFAEVRRLLDKGEIAAAEKQLERCSRMAEQQASALEEGLRGLRGERFNEQEKAYSELMGEVGDLERDQRRVAAEAEDLYDRYKERAAEAGRGAQTPEKEQARRTLERLKREVAEVPREGLPPFSQDEHDALKKRLEDVGSMLEEGDVAEALAMARHALEGLKLMNHDLADDLADGQPFSPRTADAAGRIEDAEPVAEQLIEELEQAQPSPGQMMSAEDRQRMAELRRRQRELRERAQRLGGKAEKRAKEMPGDSGEKAQRGLGEAAEKMGHAEGRMGAPDPLGARDDAQQAADRLGDLQGEMRRSARPSPVPGTRDGTGRDHEETVKIPGSDAYKPPEAFREDILDAMKKEKPPEAYRDQVKRYYEELVR
jgi:hypothetical protein